jgi:hypothetical protein
MMTNNNFNIRQMQAYAAICLWLFCNHLGIRHDSIKELLAHLMGILTVQSLPDWEQTGAGLAITGRGDPLPAGVEEAIPAGKLDAFNSLVECCVEVGIVDIYGDVTEQPKEFLEKCTKILKDSGAALPSVENLSKYDVGADTWGEAINQSQYDDILASYGVDLS